MAALCTEQYSGGLREAFNPAAYDCHWHMDGVP